jgi:hypothetical protein
MDPVFTVVQGMRYITLGDMKILGVQYRDENGGSYWELAFWSIRNPEVRICNVACGVFPSHLDSPDSIALKSAIAGWEKVSPQQNAKANTNERVDEKRGPMREEQNGQQDDLLDLG